MADLQSTCDLCGAAGYDSLIDLQRASSLRSDGVVVDRRLEKIACRSCGLVRSGSMPDAESADAEYRADYGTSRDEHTFYTARGPVTRSAAIADWMTAYIPAGLWHTARPGLEVGAGAGLLIRELQRRHAGKTLGGVEPNAAAADAGRRAGVNIRPSLQDVASGADLAWTVAVIEHVTSPTSFLRAIRGVLDPGACLILLQPTADVASYDVLFVDHLHHFSGPHLRSYAEKTGFEETAAVIGHPLMPNFSLHVWRAVSAPSRWSWNGRPAPSHAKAAALQTRAAMRRLDDRLACLSRDGRRVGAFGVREVYELARAYSDIAAFPIVCGLDDDPQRVAGRGLPFPVVRPEEARALGVTDVVLTMNAVHYGVARERCRSLGLTCHAVLDEGASS
jgi:SAM-dependent methyltransferase